MVEDGKKINQEGYFEELVDDLEKSIRQYEQDSNEEAKRLSQQEAEQEARRLEHERRAKLLQEQKRLQDETEALLMAKEKEQQLRAQALKAQEEQQRKKTINPSSDNSSTSLGPVGAIFVMLCFLAVLAFSGSSKSNTSSLDRLDEARASFSREIANTHFPINEDKYTLAEGEAIYPWTLDEFKSILVPDLPLVYSSFTLDSFVAKYGLASKADYERSSVAFDSVNLTYTLSETEFLTFKFIFYNSRYQISFKRYEGFENTPLIDYWKDKTGKTWSLADYDSLRKNSSYDTSDGQSLEEIITTFGAPDTYHSSAYDAPLSNSYTTILTYHLEDGTTITLGFTSDTNEVSGYHLSSYSMDTENSE